MRFSPGGRRDRGQPDTRSSLDRRAFLGRAAGGVVAFIGTVLAGSLATFAVSPALREEAAPWIDVGTFGEFPVGAPRLTQFIKRRRDGWVDTEEPRSAWVVRAGEHEAAVFNGRCTHLGCAYSWRAETREFVCPCHAGRFALDGQVLGGPPPRPLDTLAYRVEQGRLVIEARDFRPGVPMKVSS